VISKVLDDCSFLNKIINHEHHLTAIVDSSIHLSYGELYLMSDRLAKILLERTNGSSVIAIYMSKNIDSIVSIFACLKANRTLWLIDFHWPINYILDLFTVLEPGLVLASKDDGLFSSVFEPYRPFYINLSLNSQNSDFSTDVSPATNKFV
jgi:acyl-CoA synthetase (AMP-forming)/AMP-acid ligase II